MQILMKTINTNGCSYWCTVYTPIIAESPEAAYDAWCVARDVAKLYNVQNGFFRFAKWDFDAEYLTQNGEPDFLTVEEYFKDAITI